MGNVAGIVATMLSDERQHCDSPPAYLKESLSEKGMLFAFVHSTVCSFVSDVKVTSRRMTK